VLMAGFEPLIVGLGVNYITTVLQGQNHTKQQFYPSS
jgi:hypothetical protein